MKKNKKKIKIFYMILINKDRIRKFLVKMYKFKR